MCKQLPVSHEVQIRLQNLFTGAFSLFMPSCGSVFIVGGPGGEMSWIFRWNQLVRTFLFLKLPKAIDAHTATDIDGWHTPGLVKPQLLGCLILILYEVHWYSPKHLYLRVIRFPFQAIHLSGEQLSPHARVQDHQLVFCPTNFSCRRLYIKMESVAGTHRIVGERQVSASQTCGSTHKKSYE